MFTQYEEQGRAEEPRPTTITEEEKDSNPIYRVVYNKVRNLTKKLKQIDHLHTLNPKTLKPHQVNKLKKRDELLEEIKRQQDFAKQYKDILIEHNLGFERVDDLIKIASVLAVGNRIEKVGYCPPECQGVYGEIYKNLQSQSISSSVMLSDEVIRIYHILQKSLEKADYYRECRDYITYETQFSKPQGAVNNPKVNSLSTQIQEKITKQQRQLQFAIKTMALQSQTIQIFFKPDEHLNKQQSMFSLELAKMEKQESTSTSIGEWQCQAQSEGMTESSSPEPVLSKRARQNRRRKNKRHFPMDNFNVRKCSDTSFELTSTGMLKYMEQRE